MYCQYLQFYKNHSTRKPVGLRPPSPVVFPATSTSKNATCSNFDPSPTLSNTFIPPPFAPPAIKYRSSSPNRIIPRRCRNWVRVSDKSANCGSEGVTVENIAIVSPSACGSFRFETRITGFLNVGFGLATRSVTISTPRLMFPNWKITV